MQTTEQQRDFASKWSAKGFSEVPVWDSAAKRYAWPISGGAVAEAGGCVARIIMSIVRALHMSFSACV